MTYETKAALRKKLQDAQDRVEKLQDAQDRVEKLESAARYRDTHVGAAYHQEVKSLRQFFDDLFELEPSLKRRYTDGPEDARMLDFEGIHEAAQFKRAKAKYDRYTKKEAAQ
jgi:hypothetical protein